MKRLIFLFSIILFSGIVDAASLAKWRYPNGIPTLPSSGNSDLYIALINHKTWLFSLLDLRDSSEPESACYKNPSPEIRDISPAKINGKYVKMISICIGNGSGILQPKTVDGKAYFNNLVSSGNRIDMVLSDTTSISFPASNINEMRNKSDALNSAM
ncbi:hypothetical protein WCU76_19985 [Pectobacterium versatile]|uniref:hypothetical protein n=1 Tax=Pectobacterium versatile TaxID=2488639 RepID=UPI00301A774B